MRLGHVMVLAVALSLLAGCKTKTVVVERVTRDTLHHATQKTDSIYVRDSVHVHEWTRGDTIYVERTKWLTCYRERLKTDTIHHVRRDSIPVVVEKIVPSRISLWQRFKTAVAGGGLLVLFFIGLFFFLAKKNTPG